jgi:hypothetical protein
VFVLTAGSPHFIIRQYTTVPKNAQGLVAEKQEFGIVKRKNRKGERKAAYAVN